MGTLRDWIGTLRRALKTDSSEPVRDLGHPVTPGAEPPHVVQLPRHAENASYAVGFGSGSLSADGVAEQQPEADMEQNGVEQFLREDMLESQSDRMLSILEMFSQHPCCFTLADVSCWLELDSDRDAVAQRLGDDQRFIKIDGEHSGDECFVPVEALVRWWIGLTQRLAVAAESQLSQRQLATITSSLRRDGTWEEPPREVISVGQCFQLVRGPDESGDYHFPMARLLSYLFPLSQHQVQRILSEFCDAVRHALSLNEPPASSRIADVIAKHPGCVVLSQLAPWPQHGADIENIAKNLEADQRLVRLDSGDCESGSFIAMESLLRWWIVLTLKLAGTGEPNIAEHQLLADINLLRGDDGWRVPPLRAMAFGRRFGFVRGPDRSGLCIFPVARCLSHLSRSSLELAQEVLPDLLDYARRSILAGNEPAGHSEGRLTDAVSDVLGTLTPREQKVLRLRAGIEYGRRHTLEEAGREFKLTRERIRQIEKKALRKLHHPTRARQLVPAFLSDLMMRQGSLIVDPTDEQAPYQLFVAEFLGIPRAKLPALDLILLGVSSEELAARGPPEQWLDLSDREPVAAAIDSLYGPYLSESAFATLVDIAVDRKMPIPGSKAQKVRAAMQQIGVPAHYSEISEVYNSLFPGQPLSERSVHGILGREPLDIVWIGVRGKFALKVWGYERPSKSLFDSVTEIVESRFSVTGKPVPFQVIAAEIGKYRQVVVPSSVVIAAACNPRVKRVGGDCYIPRPVSEEEEEDDSTDELDEVLRGFEKRGRRVQRVSSGDREEEVEKGEPVSESAPSDIPSLRKRMKVWIEEPRRRPPKQLALRLPAHSTDRTSESARGLFG